MKANFFNSLNAWVEELAPMTIYMVIVIFVFGRLLKSVRDNSQPTKLSRRELRKLRGV